MLNLGLIGDVQLLEPYTKAAQERSDIHVAGKSSVGTPRGNLKLSVPEFNRIELIERADALFINRFSLLPFQLLCDLVKKTKHFFATSYPVLSADECLLLSKLAAEAKTRIQVSNPFFYYPALQWLRQNFKQPALAEISFFKNEPPSADILIQLLLMLKTVTGLNPRKTTATTFKSARAESEIININLEYGNGTLATLKYGQMGPQSKFKVKTFARDQFARFDLDRNRYSINNAPLDLTTFTPVRETDDFFKSILQNRETTTGIDDYLSVVQIVQKTVPKFNHFPGN